MALSKIQAESMNLADTFAFTGTVTGTNNLVKLAQTSVTSSVGSVEFNSSIMDSSTYRNFYFTFNSARCVNGNYDLRLRFSSDNISSFMTTIGQYKYEQINGTDNGRGHSLGSHYLTLDEENSDTNASTGYGYIMNANRQSSNSNACNMFVFSRGSTLNDNASGYYSYICNSIVGSGSNPLNGIQFSGLTNLTSGVFTIYGVLD